MGTPNEHLELVDAAPQRDDEGARQVLDTPPESAFDDITALAAAITGAPTALLSLVDAERQWFKSIVNFPVRETSRDVSFCAHAILAPHTLVVPDATMDERFP